MIKAKKKPKPAKGPKQSKPKTKPKIKAKKIGKKKKHSPLPKQKITKLKITKPKVISPKPETPNEIPKISVPTLPTVPPTSPPAPKSPIELDFDSLPLWTDRERLKMFISEENFSFSALGTAKILEASKKKINPKNANYFFISANSKGALAGAIDGYFLSGNLVIMRANCSDKFKKSELLVLLYCAAISKFKPTNVLFYAEKSPLSIDLSGQLILLGRGFGMQAIPVPLSRQLFFIRRTGKEFDFLSSGQELSQILSSLASISDFFAEAADILSKQPSVVLIPLPSSPDNLEHLHELRDLASVIGMTFDEVVFEKLKTDYVLARKDITPALL
ncbi:hypothetical protein HY988_01705 [Candidatus Micrarchaeota archaeon]|nr:hypothetical protein [Candidatus Micrarchaeota archaeon]